MKMLLLWRVMKTTDGSFPYFLTSAEFYAFKFIALKKIRHASVKKLCMSTLISDDMFFSNSLQSLNLEDKIRKTLPNSFYNMF